MGIEKLRDRVCQRMGSGYRMKSEASFNPVDKDRIVRQRPKGRYPTLYGIRNLPAGFWLHAPFFPIKPLLKA
jgi:hypothetical protein